MSWTWLIWPIGGILLLAAGFGAALLPRLRERELRRRTAWSTARAAIESASVSRDAAPGTVDEAERLLTRAELLAGEHGGTAAADSAAEYARQADRLWRAAIDG